MKILRIVRSTILVVLIISTFFLQRSFSQLPFTIHETISGVSCFGGSNGSISLEIYNGNPPFNIMWSTGATGTYSIGGLSAGMYQVVVSDQSGHTEYGQYMVTEPTPIVIIISANDSVCAPIGCDGLLNGLLTATAMGGTPFILPIFNTPYYTALWSTGQTGPYCNVAQPGAYTVTITDKNGCIARNSYQVSCPVQPTAILPSRIIHAGECLTEQAKNTISAAGDGKYYTVTLGGTSVFISGSIIHFLPGFHVEDGGRFRGYIFPPLANSPNIPATIVDNQPYQTIFPTMKPLSFEPFSVQLYPNPASDRFTIELEGIDLRRVVDVSVCDKYGKTVIRKTFRNSGSNQLSLEGCMPGIYTVQVRAGIDTVIRKIVKL